MFSIFTVQYTTEMVHELVPFAVSGLFGAAILIYFADRLPLPEFKISDDDSADGAAQPRADAAPVTPFPSVPSANLLGEGDRIVEEIVGVDTSDLNLAETEHLGQGGASDTKSEDRVPPSSNRLAVEQALGLTEDMREQMKAHVKAQMAKTEKDGVLSAASETLEPFNAVKVLEWAIFLVMVVLGLYGLNEYSKGDFGRVIAGLFPREVRALGIESWLELQGMAANDSAKGGDL